MEITKLKNFINGWVVGDFLPSLIHTKYFEVAVKEYKSGEQGFAHVHKVATEITIITSGKHKMNEQVLDKGDVVYLTPGESANYCCLESGMVVVIKTPSIKGDKYKI